MPTGRPAKPGPCAECGWDGTVFPTYRPKGGVTPPAEPEVVPLCSACRVLGAGYHGLVAQALGEPLFPLAAPADPAQGNDSRSRTQA